MVSPVPELRIRLRNSGPPEDREAEPFTLRLRNHGRAGEEWKFHLSRSDLRTLVREGTRLLKRRRA